MAYNNIFSVKYMCLNESLQIGDTIYYAKKTSEVDLTNPNQLQVNPYSDGGGITVNNSFVGVSTGTTYGAYDYYQQGLVDVTNDNEIVKIGQLIAFVQSDASLNSYLPRILLYVQSNDYLDPVPDGVYLFFSKDNRANLASLTGYYGLARLKNNSRNKAELYAVSSEAVQSSK